MSWLYLIVAILLEVCGTTCMKLSEGFTRLWPSVFLFVFYSLSFTAMTLAIKQIEVSVAYAIWSGLGISLIALIGIFWFRESVSVFKVVSLALIVIGIVCLRLSSDEKAPSLVPAEQNTNNS
jgi:small multidrug resistance pump